MRVLKVQSAGKEGACRALRNAPWPPAAAPVRLPSRPAAPHKAAPTPSHPSPAGDPYKEEMEHCVQLIMQELRGRGVPNHYTLAYQSRVGPVEWLKPYTDDTIRCAHSREGVGTVRGRWCVLQLGAAGAPA